MHISVECFANFAVILSVSLMKCGLQYKSGLTRHMRNCFNNDSII